MLLRPDVIIVCVTVDIPIESLLNLRKNCYGARVFYLLSQYRVDPLDYSFENKNMIQYSTKLQKAYLYEANEKGIEIYDFYSQHRMFSDILGYLKRD